MTALFSKFDKISAVIDRAYRGGKPLCRDLQHPLQGQTRVSSYIRRDSDLIDDAAFHQVFKRPEQMLWIDPEHGGTQATAVVQRNDEAVRVFLHQAVHQMDLGADCPFRPGWRLRKTSNNVLRGTGVVGKLDNFEPALGMCDD